MRCFRNNGFTPLIVVLFASVSLLGVGCSNTSDSGNATSDSGETPIIQGGEEDIAGFYSFVVEVGGGCSGRERESEDLVSEEGHSVYKDVRLIIGSVGCDKVGATARRCPPRRSHGARGSNSTGSSRRFSLSARSLT